MTTARMPPGTFAPTDGAAPRRLVPRHGLLVRLTHWINLLCFSLLLMTGAQIFNAHPRLYWGQYGADNDHAWLSMEALNGPTGLRGVLHLGALTIESTGVLGASKEDGALTPRGFPTWLTIPSYQDLADGRVWHLFFAWLFAINGAVYLIGGLVSRHFRRDLLPTKAELAPAHLAREVVDAREAALPQGRGRASLQRAAEAHLHVRRVRAAAADGADRPDDVARPGLRIPRAARRVRRPAVGTLDPLHLRVAAGRVRGRARRDGAGLGRVEQPALDGHRQVRDRRPRRTRHEPERQIEASAR